MEVLVIPADRRRKAVATMLPLAAAEQPEVWNRDIRRVLAALSVLQDRVLHDHLQRCVSRVLRECESNQFRHANSWDIADGLIVRWNHGIEPIDPVQAIEKALWSMKPNQRLLLSLAISQLDHGLEIELDNYSLAPQLPVLPLLVEEHEGVVTIRRYCDSEKADLESSKVS